MRPAVIIQNNIGNLYSPTTIVAATTGQLNKPALPTHVFLWASENRCLKKNTIILLEHIRTIDRSRLGTYIGSLTVDTMNILNHALSVSVGLPMCQ